MSNYFDSLTPEERDEIRSQKSKTFYEIVWDADSKKNETEVYLEESESDNYWAWLIAFGWLELSLAGQLMLMDKEQKDKLHKYINIAKSQYPQNFKSDENEK